MPKLNHPGITKGDAVSVLLALYKSDAAFMKEWGHLKDPYHPLITKCTKDVLKFWAETDLSPSEGWQALISFNQGDGEDPFDIENNMPDVHKLQPYFDSLGALAEKWKIRASWSVAVFFIMDLFDEMALMGMKAPDEIPIETFNFIYPWKPPAPPLEFNVPAWAIIVLGRKKILSEIAEKLRKYETDLKVSGLKEYPSSLEQHAQWWFEHYVNGKKYKDLANEFPDALEETIRRAVWKFSKLVGIRVN